MIYHRYKIDHKDCSQFITFWYAKYSFGQIIAFQKNYNLKHKAWYDKTPNIPANPNPSILVYGFPWGIHAGLRHNWNNPAYKLHVG